MKVSPNGAPILQGEGVAAVRKKIEEAFRDARINVPTHSEETRTEIADLETTEIKVVMAVKQTTLEEKAILYFRAAEKHINHVTGRRRQGGVHHISVPTEDAATLVDQALRNSR